MISRSRFLVRGPRSSSSKQSFHSVKYPVGGGATSRKGLRRRRNFLPLSVIGYAPFTLESEAYHEAILEAISIIDSVGGGGGGIIISRIIISADSAAATGGGQEVAPPLIPSLRLFPG